MHRRALLLALGVSCTFAFQAQAQAKPRPLHGRAGLAEPAPKDTPSKQETLVEVSVLHGTHDKADTDPRIKHLSELREGPFAKYESYKLLSKTDLPLSRGGKRQLKLPNGRLLEARLENILADGSSRLVASINRPDGKDFLPLLEVKAKPGQRFIVAGQTYKHGILVLVFTVLR
jgi:hypothetical protein